MGNKSSRRDRIIQCKVDGSRLQYVTKWIRDGIVVASVDCINLDGNIELFKICDKYSLICEGREGELVLHWASEMPPELKPDDLIIYSMHGHETCGKVVSKAEIYTHDRIIVNGYCVRRLWQIIKGKHIDPKEDTYDNITWDRAIYKVPDGIVE